MGRPLTGTYSIVNPAQRANSSMAKVSSSARGRGRCDMATGIWDRITATSCRWRNHHPAMAGKAGGTVDGLTRASRSKHPRRD
jgi:hypothetical protein